MTGTITIQRRHLAYAAAAALVLLALGLLTGCGAGKFTEPFRDSPVNSQNNSAAIEVTMPDGFSNAAAKCIQVNGQGFLIVTIYHGNRAYGAPAVTPTPACKVPLQAGQ